jgi:hypothetical protein
VNPAAQSEKVQMPISPDHLATYFNAGMATAAYEFGVAIRRISLQVNAGIRERPQLMPLATFVASRRKMSTPNQAYIDYATVLLAGSAGRCLGLEAYLAYPRPHLEMERLQRAYLCEAALCLEPETDRAFSIIVAQLHKLHNGDAATTFDALWSRAIQLLRQPPPHRRLEMVVEAIRQQRVLNAQELVRILQQ